MTAGRVSPYERWYSEIDHLLALPFDRLPYQAETAHGGLGHHILHLESSRSFWEERSIEHVEAAEAAIEQTRDDLARELRSRWGPCVALEFEPHLQDLLTGRHVAEPLAYLATYAPEALIWRLPRSDRWLALAVIQADTEYPFVLIAAVGELSALPATLVPPQTLAVPGGDDEREHLLTLFHGEVQFRGQSATGAAECVVGQFARGQLELAARVASGAGGVLVGAGDGGVHRHVPRDQSVRIRPGLERGEDRRPDTVELPAAVEPCHGP